MPPPFFLFWTSIASTSTMFALKHKHFDNLTDDSTPSSVHPMSLFFASHLTTRLPSCSDNYPSFQIKAKNTISIDIHDRYISPKVLQHVEHILQSMTNIVRLSISGNIRLWFHEDVANSLKTTAQMLASSLYHRLSVLILDVPVDLTDHVRGSINVTHLKLRSYNTNVATTRESGMAVACTLSPCNSINKTAKTRTYFSARAGRPAIPYTGRFACSPLMRHVNFFLHNVSGTITELAHFYNGFTTNGISIPSSSSLRTLSCLVHNAHDLLGERFPTLHTLNLHGMGPTTHSFPRAPNLNTAKHLDRVLFASSLIRPYPCAPQQ